MDNESGPWQAEVAIAGMNDLNSLWEKWTSPAGLSQTIDYYQTAHQVHVSIDQSRALLGESLQARKAALENASSQPGPDVRLIDSTAERVDAAIIEHLKATDAYAVAVVQSAKLDAEAKLVAAKEYLLVKANVPEGQKRVTDTEANRTVDANQEVLNARLAADISAAQTKAAKAQLDHWEQVIGWGRSVYSRETRADTR